MSNPGATWSDERVERLKRLWAEGLSASQIATELGAVSRNAVIGKVHRLKLPGRASIAPKSLHTKRPPLSRLHKPAPTASVARPRVHRNLAIAFAPIEAEEPIPIREAEISAPVPDARYLTLLELRPDTCRWPIGDPKSPDFRFCGAPTTPDQPYCRTCSQRAHQTKETRPAKRPRPRAPTWESSRPHVQR